MKVKILPQKKKFRLFICLFFLLIYHLPSGLATETGQAEKMQLEEAFLHIGQEYGVFFNYDREIVAHITVEYEKGAYSNVQEALSAVFSQTDLHYQIFDKRYVAVYQESEKGIQSMKKMIAHFQEIVDEKENKVRPDIKKVQPLPSRSLQEIYSKRLVFSVSGTVTDQNGEPLIGVNILVKGTNKGTTTDFEGRFTLEDIDENAVLVVSYVGYQTQEIAVAGKSNLTISMVSDSQLLDEVVVVGYGTQRKKDLTGAVTSISGDEIDQPSASTFDQMLQGKVPGVQINQTSGAPGGNVNILVRGISSITGGNQPLFVVDGYPIGTGGAGDMRDYNTSIYSSSGMANNADERVNPLASINPSDIESIDILKDASATAIYGSRGANGVVLITTKRGSYNKSEIHLDASYGFQEVENKLELYNAQQYAEYVALGRDNAWEFQGGSKDDPNDVRPASVRVRPSFRNPESITTNTDWQDVIFQVAPVNDLQLSIRGGNDNSRYYVGGGYYSQDGIVKTSDYNRFNLSVNLDALLTDKLKISTSTRGTYGYGRFANTEGHYGRGGILMTALAASPTIPIYDDEGNYYFNHDDVTDGLGWLAHPLSVLEGFQDRRKILNLFSNNYIEYKFTESLTFKSSIGINTVNNNIRLWRSSAVPLFTTLNYPSNGGATKEATLNWLNENTFSYNNLINNKHLVNAVAGFSAQKNSFDRLSAGASDFPTDYVTYISAGIVNSGTQLQSEWSLLSVIARVNYSFNDKFLLTGTLRKDGSSRFGKNHKWGTFPSISVGYNLSEEPFLRDSRVVSNLKVRASYGISGNNQIGNYSHIGLLSNVNYVANNSQVPGLVPVSLSNDDLTWEKSKQTNIGLDLGLFSDRLLITMDVYKDLKTDLLLDVQLPAASGFNQATQNIGDIENKGIDLGLNAIPIQTANFQWNSNIIFSANKNKVLKIASEGGRIFTTDEQITEVGLPISSFYLINKIGVFQSEEEVANSALYHPRTQPGDLKFEDVDGNGVINQNDRKVVGDPWPDFTWGFNNTFSLGNFDLDVAIIGSQGADTYFQAGRTVLNSAAVQNQLAISFNRWKSPSDPGDGKFPRPIRNNYANGFGPSSHFLFDASFVRIKNIKLSYSLPTVTAARLKLKKVSFFANVSNLITFTDYPGYDPESSTSGGNVVASGYDYLTYPLARTYTFGLKASL